MNTSNPTPEKIVQIATGGWATAILGVASQYSLFKHLEGEGSDAASLLEKIPISPRGLQALLDGLTGLGLLELKDRKYRNSPEASFYLVEGKPAFMGGFGQVNLNDLERWAKFSQVVKTGIPVDENTSDVPENEYWEMLVTAIASLSLPVAQVAADRLKLAQAGPISWLDVGGGSGVYSAVWLKANPQAQAYQLDWANVNRIGKKYVGNFGVADRFHTIDGDFHKTDFGAEKYDFAIYSHIAHMETPQDNLETFRKLKRALKPGGTLLVNDFVLNDDRTGNPFSLTFYAMMVLHTKGGATYRQADYRAWLAEAGFKKVEIEATRSPASMIFAS